MGGAPPHKNNLIGTAARGWTQIGLFKMNTFSFRLFCSHSLLAGGFVFTGRAGSARSPPYNQADHLKNSKTSLKP